VLAAGLALVMTSERAGAAAVPPTRLGINLPSPAFWLEARSFTNLALYASFKASAAGGKWQPIDPALLGPGGWPANLPAGTQAYLMLLMPQGAKKGDVFRCSWTGQATVTVQGTVTMLRGDTNSLNFSLQLDAADSVHGVSGRTARAWVAIANVSPSAPITDLDCREASRPHTQIYDPAFVSALAPYQVVRFMDWMNVNSVRSASFARETLPQGPPSDGGSVTLANMIALATEAKIDPWFTIPYAADDDYVRRFAQMAHDRLPPGRIVYVELGNEMWNSNFPSGRQVQVDGLAAGLSTNPYQAQLRQYAARSARMLDIWTKVYADKPKQLVRIVSVQNFNTYSTTTILEYGDVAKLVDAIGTAPYFGNLVYPRLGTKPRPANLDEAFVAVDRAVDEALAAAGQQKAIADRLGKRLIAYESGQHIQIPDDVDLLRKVNTDPRMGEAYRRYLEGWSRSIGDTIMLYHMVGAVERFGAWGLQEYDGQPLDQAPKKKAVLDFAAAHHLIRQ
jgi:hypothetical protein